jgi:tRNA pseudouridine38-40 synthase
LVCVSLQQTKVTESLRYFIEIAYNGKNYFGWQCQPNAISVQETLEKALSTLFRVPIKIVGAGRTDAGVHAKQIFAHFDTFQDWNPMDLVFKLNSLLPNDIAIQSIFEVHKNAHARFDALSRTYVYRVSLLKNPFTVGYAFQIHHKPNIALMNEAAKVLLFYKDFQCFSKSKTDVNTYNCTIQLAEWIALDNELIFTIKADRFLRNMVRAIVGTLLDIGSEKITIHDLHQIIKGKDRSKAGASVPAEGLYLTKIEYPEKINI